MAYTAVSTYTTNDLITAAHANTYWRDNINALWPYTTAGDLPYASSSSALTRLGIGSSGYMLFSNGSAPYWDQFMRSAHWRVLPHDSSLEVANGVDYFVCPNILNGYNLTQVWACVDTASTSGLVTVMLANGGTGLDLLTTAITIDANERTSYTAATPAVINLSRDDMATGTRIRVDVDGIGTGTLGLVIHLVFELP